MVGVQIALHDVNEEKYIALHKSHFKNFSSNINTPNLRNNLVNFVFVVYGERGPSLPIREEKMNQKYERAKTSKVHRVKMSNLSRQLRARTLNDQDLDVVVAVQSGA